MQEKYDRYLQQKTSQFKRVARKLISTGRISSDGEDAVIEALDSDVLAKRNQAWVKEKAKLLGYLKDRDETESTIEAEVRNFWLSCALAAKQNFEMAC